MTPATTTAVVEETLGNKFDKMFGDKDKSQNKSIADKFTICIVSNDEEQILRITDSIYHSFGGVMPEISIMDGDNKHDMFTGYNEAIKTTIQSSRPYLVFVHHDVEFLNHVKIWKEVADLLDKPSTGVLGIAGSQTLGNDGVWWSQQGHLTGAAMHGNEAAGASWMTAFGPYARAIVLDGVCLMMSRKVFDKLGGFDEKNFTGFDFYDLDISLRAHLAGYKNYTVPILLKHYSPGDVTGKTGWFTNKATFLRLHGKKLPINL